ETHDAATARMIASLLALSLSNSFTKVGAVAAFVALVGIAVLSLLSFSQARELKRLRDWAGRAPERAAELEQRVSAVGTARVQRSAATSGQPPMQTAPATPGSPAAATPAPGAGHVPATAAGAAT